MIAVKSRNGIASVREGNAMAKYVVWREHQRNVLCCNALIVKYAISRKREALAKNLKAMSASGTAIVGGISNVRVRGGGFKLSYRLQCAALARNAWAGHVK